MSPDRKSSTTTSQLPLNISTASMLDISTEEIVRLKEKQSNIKYKVPDTSGPSRSIHNELQSQLKRLSEEATFFRDSAKTAKTSTKKRYYQKKLVNSTKLILQLLTHMQAGL